MEMKKIDRLILSNQYRILEALYPDERVAYAKSRAVIEGGYSLHYSDLAKCLNEELIPQQCEEVDDVLEMFRSSRESSASARASLTKSSKAASCCSPNAQRVEVKQLRKLLEQLAAS